MTKDQLLAFIKIRNASGFSSNLQFSIDAQEAGFDVAALGRAHRYEPGGYRWFTDHGELIEHPGGQMELVETR